MSSCPSSTPSSVAGALPRHRHRRVARAMAQAEGDANVLTLSWVFGFSRDVAIQNLCDENRSAIFYVSAHTGVIHDISSRTQKLLQGHCNPISCTCAS
eukprot:1598876-Prymnesium_polylepis.1